jgi:hypothetical protein
MLIVGSIGHCIIGNASNLVNALLGPLQDNGGPTPTHGLISGSPAIDAGNCAVLVTDQRGVWRPQGGACDIGVVEKMQ